MSHTDGCFPRTRHSVLALVHSDDQQARQIAWDALVRAYWKPVYKYLRLRWRADQDTASDWTQEFFARAIEKDQFERFDPSKARFRTFLRVCLDGFAANQRESLGREKRGGRVSTVSMQQLSAERGLVDAELPAPDRLDEYFQREWTRSLFELALEDLKADCERDGRAQDFELLNRYDIEESGATARISYADLAREFGIPLTQVTNRLHATRARLRARLLERLREVCASDDEFRAEARSILGGNVR